MSEETTPPEESKIHVDSDWKKRARDERELADDTKDRMAGEAGRDRPPLPEATLATHVTQLATQTAFALGDLEARDEEPGEPDLPLARFLIDTLAMLEEKTRGNRSEAETRILEDALYGLRLRYVEKTRSAPEA
jgi:hypothetical protein